MSPDPLLNSGRPNNPQTWNRYTYTLNNPLKFIDPTGLYEWAVSCNEKKDSQCHQERQWFRNALTKLNDALSIIKKTDPKSQEYLDLKRVSDFYGKENEKTGIKVAFNTNTVAGSSTSEFAKFNIKITNDNANAWKAQGFSVDANVEAAAAVAHEGSNAYDRFGRTRSMEDYARIFRDEENAYRTQSTINYIFNTQSPYGLWNPSWAKVDAQKYREMAIKENAQKSTDRTFGIRRK